MPVQFRFDFDKFLACLEYMAFRGVTELDKYKVAKLLFLADKYHLVRYSRPIIGDKYCALPYGPVPSKSLDLIKAFLNYGANSPDANVRRMAESLALDKNFHNPRIASSRSPEFQTLSKSDMMALDITIEKFGSKGFDELLSITHATYEYRSARKREPDSQNSEMHYEDFFEEDTNAIEGALEEMLENAEIREAFPDIGIL